MKSMELLMGMSCIDDELIEEALRMKRSPRAYVMKRAVAAACIGLAAMIGVLTLSRGGTTKETLQKMPTQIESIQTPSRSETPGPDSAADKPRQDTPEDEIILPVPTTSDPPETEAPIPAQSSDPSPYVQSAGRQTEEKPTPGRTDPPQPPSPVFSEQPIGESIPPTAFPETSPPTPLPEQTAEPTASPTPAPGTARPEHPPEEPPGYTDGPASTPEISWLEPEPYDPHAEQTEQPGSGTDGDPSGQPDN